MRQTASWVAVFCLVVSAAHGAQLTGHEEIKFERVATSSGVTESGAPWQGTLYETTTRTRVHLTIVHLESREGAKNEFSAWLKLKGIRIVSNGKVQDEPTTIEERAVVKYPVPSECDEGTAILATVGTALRIVQSCSVKAAYEFEKQVKRETNQDPRLVIR
jgi:hypothetical protein